MTEPSQVIKAIFPNQDPNTSDEWYTEEHIIGAVREVVGQIDLDPASCTEANKIVKANRIYTIEDDGLSKPWIAETLWLNPPRGMEDRVSVQSIWVNRLIAHYRRKEVKEAMFIIRAVIGYHWFNKVWDICSNVCFLEERPSYYRGYVGVSGGQDQITGAIFYLGLNVKKFQEKFRSLGRVFDQNSYR